MSVIHEMRAPQIVQRVIPEAIRRWSPRTMLGMSILRSLPYLPPELRAELVERISSTMVFESRLSIRVIRGHGLYLAGLIPAAEMVVEDHGVVSRKVITTAAVNFIVDAFQNTTEVENFKYHGIGTGSTAEAVGDTALVTELTTEYNPDNTRATGSQTENGANVYRSVGTNTVDAAPGAALREHGLFSAASGGTLFDRSVFAAITLSSGDSLQTTYDGTFTSGG